MVRLRVLRLVYASSGCAMHFWCWVGDSSLSVPVPARCLQILCRQASGSRSALRVSICASLTYAICLYAEDSVTFRVTTKPGGQNSGREYNFRANSAEAALEWVYVIRDLSKAAAASKLRSVRALLYYVRGVYWSPFV